MIKMNYPLSQASRIALIGRTPRQDPISRTTRPVLWGAKANPIVGTELAVSRRTRRIRTADAVIILLSSAMTCRIFDKLDP